MDKRKIKLDRPKISSEEIAKGMDFQAVLKGAGVAVKPWYTKPWIIGAALTGVVVLSTIAAFYFGSVDENSTTITTKQEDLENTSKPKQEDLPTQKQRLISKPFEDLAVPADEFKVNAAEGAKLFYKSGSTIEVPKNAFLDAEGQVVSGEVNIEYVEYHDPIDFFVSGIPMDYDSADVNYQFHSAGMLELVATQKGQPVYANPDNLIEVAIASKKDGNNFNVYYLDTANASWSFMGKDQMSPIADEMTTEQVLAVRERLNERYERLVSNQPLKGEMLNANAERLKAKDESLNNIREELRGLAEQIATEAADKPQKPARFNLNYIEEEFPELSAFQNVKFEIGLEPENAHFSQDDYTVEWEDMKLTENEAGKNYLLTLIAEDLTKSYVVYPVADGVAKTAATLEYEKQMEVYNARLLTQEDVKQTLEQEEKAKISELDVTNKEQVEQMHQEELAAWEAEIAALTDEKEAFEENLKKAMQVEALVQRAFKISQFGIWNCDQPVLKSNVKKIEATFTNESGELLSLVSAHLVDHSINGVIRYSKHDFAAFKYNPAVENTIWGITIDQKLAWCESSEFLKIEEEGEQHTFRLRTTDQKFNSVAALKALLIDK